MYYGIVAEQSLVPPLACQCPSGSPVAFSVLVLTKCPRDATPTPEEDPEKTACPHTQCEGWCRRCKLDCKRCRMP